MRISSRQANYVSTTFKSSESVRASIDDMRAADGSRIGDLICDAIRLYCQVNYPAIARRRKLQASTGRG